MYNAYVIVSNDYFWFNMYIVCIQCLVTFLGWVKYVYVKNAPLSGSKLLNIDYT